MLSTAGRRVVLHRGSRSSGYVSPRSKHVFSALHSRQSADGMSSLHVCAPSRRCDPIPNLSTAAAATATLRLDINAGCRPCDSPSTAAAAMSILHGQRRSASVLTLSTHNMNARSSAQPTSQRGRGYKMSTRLFSSESLTPKDIEEMKKNIALLGSRMSEKSVAEGDKLLRKLIDEQLRGTKNVKMTSDFLNGTLHAYRVLSVKTADKAKVSTTRPTRIYAEKADELLKCVEKAYDQDPSLSPNTKSYSMVIDAYAKCGDPAKAEKILQRMFDLWKAGNENVHPDTVLYNSVINAWANSGRRNAAQRAEVLLQHIEDLSQKGYDDLRPNAITFNTVINAHAKSGEKEAARRAEKILNRLMKLFEDGQEECRPDVQSFNTVIDAWAKSGDANAGNRAEEILLQMDDLSRQGYEEVRPNTITFNTVINAHAKKAEKGAARRAEKILHHMMRMFEGGREECRPSIRSFNSVIDAWARSGDANAGKQAEALLQLMEERSKTKGCEDLQPDTITYNCAINAHAKCGEKGSAPQAEDVLNRMTRLFEDGREECRPSIRSFTSVIDAWARSKDKEAPQSAERIMQIMKNLSTKGYKDVEPDTITYNSLINAYAVSTIPNKAVKAFQILKGMESETERGNKHVAPTVYSYSAVLKACAWSHGRGTDTEKVLRIAIQTFEKLCNASDLSVGPIHYNFLFHTIANTTTGEQNTKMTREVFRLCCEDGLMNDILLKMLRRGLPKRLFEDLVGSDALNVTVDDLPREWSRNDRRRRR